MSNRDIIRRKAVDDTFEGFLMSLDAWLGQPDKNGGFGFGLCPISPAAKDTLARKIAEFKCALDAIPPLKRTKA